VFNTSKHFKDVDTGTQTFLLMLLGGLLAFCMTVAEFSLIKNTSTVTLSVAGISKEVVIISLSVLIYHDVLTPVNLLGYVYLRKNLNLRISGNLLIFLLL
jgi:solute carrier family 35, member C2